MTPQRLCWLTAGFLLFSGCSKPTASVSGKVLLDGQPLARGSITFFPVDGTPGQEGGDSIEEGKYHIDGLAMGKYRVDITGIKRIAKRVNNPVMPSDMINEEVAAVPPEFNAKSQLIREIELGDNKIDFVLQSDRARK
jgi:hypothetical protein